MKKTSLWGLSLLIALTITACGDTSGEEIVDEGLASVVSEAESDSIDQDVASSFVSEDLTEGTVADAGNLPDALGEGETALIAYNEENEEIAESLPDVEVDLDALREQNPDICAYIVIPGTAINRPILKKDDSNEYYLEHNAEDEEDSKGSVFMDMGNETDFTDPVTCLYARSGEEEPFCNLISYYDADFMSRNEYIYIYSDEYVIRYRIFASYGTDDTERSLVKYNFYDYEEYRRYIDDILSIRDMSAVVNKDVQDSALSSWNIITLTGIDDAGGRQVLQAAFDGRISAK